MKRIGFLLKVRADRLEEYKARHKAVWPEMRAALHRSGWHNYSLFLSDDGLLFGVFDTPVDLQTAVDSMAKEEINARWQAEMAPFFEGIGGKPADEGMIELEEVFYLE
jgi:L-rhamnose mutarotase